MNTTGPTGVATGPITFPNPLQLLGSTTLEQNAANILHNPNVGEVTSQVSGTVDPTTGALSITATDSDPVEAQDAAKAYTQAFINQIKAIAQDQIDKINLQIANDNKQIAGLQAQLGSTSNPNPAITAQITGLGQALGTLQSELSTIQLGEPYASVQVSADFPSSPIGLSKTKILAIGLLAGLLVGCGAALMREQFDTRLRTSPDIAEVTNAPVLAELPQDSDVRAGKVSIALVQAPQSRTAESIRELRTSLRVILDDAPCPTIIVTSPEAGDGKTFVAANVAAAWALSGSKVIVISADFRRPRLEEVFGLQPTGLPGLADVIKANWKKPEADGRSGGRPPAVLDRPGLAAARGLGPQTPGASNRRIDGPGRGLVSDRSRRSDNTPADESSVSSYLIDTGIWGLSLLPAGTHLETPSELFGSPGMQPVMDQLPLLADVVLFDTPPVLAAPDTAILGGLASGAVVVAAEGKTGRPELERTVHRLESTHCRVLGVVVNRTRRPTSDSYQYYAYKQQ